jgi:hypothetical protein
MPYDTPEEHRLSRRGLVKVAVGTATVGAVAVGSARTPALAASVTETGSHTAPGTSGRGQAPDAAPAITGELLVHVRDARTGDLDLYLGDRRLQVRDRDLAARLAAFVR